LRSRWIGEDDRGVGADREDLRVGAGPCHGGAHWEGEDRADVLPARDPHDRLESPGPEHRRRAAVGDVLARRALRRNELLLTHVVLDHREAERDLLRAGHRRGPQRNRLNAPMTSATAARTILTASAIPYGVS